jgi:hypothetical protein
VVRSAGSVITFFKGDTRFKGEPRRYRSVLLRPDGVTVQLDGGAYNRIGGPTGEVPHDIAHLIVEDELGMDRGIWGTLVAGGLLGGSSVISGRQRPHAAAYSRKVLEASEKQLGHTEMMTRAVCDLSLTGTPDPRALRVAAGERWWWPTTGDMLVSAFDRLQRVGDQWARLPVGETLQFPWRLIPDGTRRPRRR